MKVKKNHIKIGDYIIQYNEDEGFVAIDKEGKQIGYAYEHLNDVLENVLKYG